MCYIGCNSNWRIYLLVLSLGISINPSGVPELACEWILEHLVGCRVRLVLFLVHDNRDVACGSSSSVETWSIGLVLSHCCICVDAGLRGAPLNVATRVNRIIKVGVSKDGAM